MSSAYIAELAAEAADRARDYGLTPLAFESLHDVDRNFGRVPNLGDYRPSGWKLAEHKLVDKTGWGYESEPALSVSRLKEWMKSHLTDAATSGWGIIEEGQFQIVVGRFIRSR